MSASAREVVVGGVRALRRGGLWWTVAIVAFVVLNAAFWPSIEGTDVLEGFEEMGELMEAFGAQDLGSAAGYLDGQLFALMLPLLLSGMSIATLSALTAGDEDAGRLELLQALPVSRRAVWFGRWLAATAVLLGAATLVGAVMVASLGPFSFEEVGADRIIAAMAGCALLAGFHAAVAFAAAASGLSRARSVGVAMFVLVVGYVTSYVLPLAEGLVSVRRLSPWFWALGQQPVSNGVSASRLVLLVFVTALVVGGGLYVVERRDIRSV